MVSKIKEPCVILTGCLCFFTGISILSSNFESLKNFDLLADIKQDEQNNLQLASSDKKSKEKKNNDKQTISEKPNEGLAHFFTCLDSLKAKKKKIRIAHFGDSMIEGDLISSTLREELQNTFGGSGVGFISASPLNPTFRQSINQSYSENWENYNIKDKNKKFEIGISGNTSVSEGKTWIHLKSIQKENTLRLFYGNTKTALNFNLTLDSNSYKLIANQTLQEHTYTLIKNEVNIQFESQTQVPIYGLSVESNDGIILDNFSSRGSSGTLFKEQNLELLKQFENILQYDLIILHYGINVANAKNTNYDWYERNMLSNIKFLQQVFPTTSFLIIGCSDRAVKYKGVYATSKGIEPLIETQKKLAQTTNSGFINFYSLMGGENSMLKWVNGDTCFANKDYTHFNHQGAKKAGKLIYNDIIKQYDSWKKQHAINY